MTEFIKCEDCPLEKSHFLLREVDPSIIGCNYVLVNRDLGLTRIVHKTIRKPPAKLREANSDRYLG